MSRSVRDRGQRPALSPSSARGMAWGRGSGWRVKTSPASCRASREGYGSTSSGSTADAQSRCRSAPARAVTPPWNARALRRVRWISAVFSTRAAKANSCVTGICDDEQPAIHVTSANRVIPTRHAVDMQGRHRRGRVLADRLARPRPAGRTPPNRLSPGGPSRCRCRPAGGCRGKLVSSSTGWRSSGTGGAGDRLKGSPGRR